MINLNFATQQNVTNLYFGATTTVKEVLFQVQYIRKYLESFPSSSDLVSFINRIEWVIPMHLVDEVVDASKNPMLVNKACRAFFKAEQAMKALDAKTHTVGGFPMVKRDYDYLGFNLCVQVSKAPRIELDDTHAIDVMEDESLERYFPYDWRVRDEEEYLVNLEFTMH